MFRTREYKLLYLLGLSALLFMALAGLVRGPASVSAQANQPTSLPGRTITVVGEGTVRTQPDIARATIGIDVVKGSVKEASAASSDTLAAVLAALTELGVADEDIQTAGYSVYAERFGPDGPLAENDTRYRVTNNLLVIIRDLEQVGPLLDAAIDAGANNIYGVEFSVDDTTAAETEARTKAVDDAQRKAAELAALNGVTVGDVVAISEIIGNAGGYYAGGFAEEASMALGGGGTPISPGQLALTMRLEIVYAIGE